MLLWYCAVLPRQLLPSATPRRLRRLGLRRLRLPLLHLQPAPATLQVPLLHPFPQLAAVLTQARTASRAAQQAEGARQEGQRLTEPPLRWPLRKPSALPYCNRSKTAAQQQLQLAPHRTPRHPPVLQLRSHAILLPCSQPRKHIAVALVYQRHQVRHTLPARTGSHSYYMPLVGTASPAVRHVLCRRAQGTGNKTWQPSSPILYRQRRELQEPKVLYHLRGS